MDAISKTFMINGAFVGFQALQYKTLVQQNRDPKGANNIHQITLLFLAVNTTWTLWNQGALLKVLSKNKNWVLLSVTCAGGGITYSYASSAESHLYERPDPQPFLTKQQLIARWAPPPIEKALKGLFVAEGIQAIALLCFGKNKLFPLIHLIGATAALYESSKKPWLEITCRSSKNLIFEEREISNTEITYYTFILQKNENLFAVDCIICQNHETIPRDTFSCSQMHGFHLKCLIDSLATNVFTLGERLATHRLRSYGFRKIEFQLPKDLMPHCPLCRGKPSEAFMTFNYGRVREI